MCLSVSSPPAHVTTQSPQVCTVPPAPTITTWITNPPLGIYGLTGTQEKLHRGSPGSAQDARTWPLWRGSARPVGTVYTLSQVPTHVPNPHPFPRSYRCKGFSPQTGRSWFCPGGSAPQPWRVPVCHFHTKGTMSLAGVMPRFCPSDACVEALPPAPPSGPAFGGKVFEQVIELNEAI